MKKEAFALILLAILIATSIWNLAHINTITESTAVAVEEARRHSGNGDTEKAAEILISAKNSWDEHRLFLMMTLNHNDIYAIDEAFIQLEEAIFSGNANSADSSAKLMASRLENIADIDRISLGSIL